MEFLFFVRSSLLGFPAIHHCGCVLPREVKLCTFVRVRERRRRIQQLLLPRNLHLERHPESLSAADGAILGP